MREEIVEIKPDSLKISLNSDGILMRFDSSLFLFNVSNIPSQPSFSIEVADLIFSQ